MPCFLTNCDAFGIIKPRSNVIWIQFCLKPPDYGTNLMIVHGSVILTLNGCLPLASGRAVTPGTLPTL
jgi:hypothetical protein